MIRFTLRSLYKNKTLWAWPGLSLLFVLAIAYWGDIASAHNSHSFILLLGDGRIPAPMAISQLTSFIVLFSIIGFPNHFAKALKPERGALLLSKPISRSEFFFADFASMITVTVSYALITVALLAALVGLKGGIFPGQLLAGLLIFLPLQILTYYITIVLFLILTNSYLGGALLGWLVTGFSGLFLNSDKVLQYFGWDSAWVQTTLDTLSYLIPSSSGVEKLLGQIYKGGFAALDGGMLAFVLASCLPLAALSYYLFLNKEF